MKAKAFGLAACLGLACGVGAPAEAQFMTNYPVIVVPPPQTQTIMPPKPNPRPAPPKPDAPAQPPSASSTTQSCHYQGQTRVCD